jgi:glutathione S-transferase
VLLNLEGDQFQPEFAAINPLQRIPVVVDDGFRVVESLAILDYLEAKYPSPALMPKDAQMLATVRMVEMVAVNELQPATIPLTKQMVQLDVEHTKVEAARQQIATVLQFYESLLGDSPYFAGEELTLADIVAGTLVPSLPLFSIDLAPYPKVKAWSQWLAQRESWHYTAPSDEQIEAAIPNVRKILARR